MAGFIDNMPVRQHLATRTVGENGGFGSDAHMEGKSEWLCGTV